MNRDLSEIVMDSFEFFIYGLINLNWSSLRVQSQKK